MAAEYSYAPPASWLEVVQQLLDVQRPQQAEQLVRRHLLQYPRDAHAHGVLALALSRQHRLLEAYHSASKAVTLDPEQAYGFYMLALVLIAQQRPGSARRAIQKALRLSPQTPEYLGIKALLDNHFQRHRIALATTTAGLALDPTHKQCLLQRIAACQALERFEEATDTLHYLARHHPLLGEAHRLLGQEALRQWQPAEARLHLREALRLDPTDDLARYALAQAARADLWLPRQVGRLQAQGRRLLTAAQHGRPWAWVLLVPLVLLAVVLAVPLLLAYAVAHLQWRLHPDVRYLRLRPTDSLDYLKMALHRYAPLLSAGALLLATLLNGGWLVWWAGISAQALASTVAAGLAAGALGSLRLWWKSLAVTTPLRTYNGLLLLSLGCLLMSAVSAFFPVVQPWAAGVLLLATGSIFYWLRRTLRRATDRAFV